jgi:formate-nitrite transporter family protein
MESKTGSRLVEPLTARDHVRGTQAAAVSLVEYGDFECPYCRSAVEIVNGLQQALGDQLAFAFRHFPMREAHPHAQHAAEVAEAAAAQGRFWDMHDRLFAAQDALDDESLLRYARELSLDWERVRDELASHSHAARIEKDLQGGIASGVTSTPTFFIDGTRYDGSVSLPKMLAAIRELHPEVAVSHPLPNAPRIPRVRWPREDHA